MDFNASMAKFKGFVDRWNLINDPCKGAKFMWSNFQENHSLSSLNQFLFSKEWDEMFLGRFHVALPRLTLDHIPSLWN